MNAATSFSGQLIRILLRAYPRWFRRRYGSEMALMLLDQRQEERYRRRWGGTRYWTGVLSDILAGAVRIQVRQLKEKIRSSPPSGNRSPNSRGSHMDRFRQDLSYALRTLARRPGWTFAAVATLALGIGATTAIFSLVNGVLLRPLPYPEPDRLVTLEAYIPSHSDSWSWFGETRRSGSVSYPVTEIIGQAQQVAEPFGRFSSRILAVDVGEGAELMSSAMASWQVFQALQVKPSIGRLFIPLDDRQGAPNTVLLSHGLWQERFAGDPQVLGRSLQIDERPHTVIGVMPAGFAFPDHQARFWVSMAAQPRAETTHYLSTLGRLRPELTEEQARAQLSSLLLQAPTGAPGHFGEIGVRMSSLLDRMVSDVRPQLLIFLGAVAAVLLIGCLNVVNLMLSRSASRQRELSLRTALGAERPRLVRQMVTESAVLGLWGGLLGALLAMVINRALIAIAPGQLPRNVHLGIDGQSLLFTAALSLAVGVLIGLWPALRHSRPDLKHGLHAGARGPSGSLANHRLRAVLVVAQVGLALTLLVNAGLLLRSFDALASTNTGFNTQGLLTFRPALPLSRYGDAQAARAFHLDLLDRLRALPEVESATVTATVPFGGHIGEALRMEGWEAPKDERDLVVVDVQVVDPDFFRVLGIGPIQGRVFTEADREGAPRTAVVNRSLVQQFLSDVDPLGQRIRIGDFGQERWLEIVGVVPDIRPYHLARRIHPMVYESILQSDEGWNSGGQIVRTRTPDAAALAPAVRESVRTMDAGVPLTQLSTMQQRLDVNLSQSRFRALLLSAFGLTALLLAVIGVYGVMAHGVVQRRQEIGVRMALGAAQHQILGWIGRRGAVLTAAGLLMGLAGSLASTRLLESYLFEMTPYDETSFVLALVVLAVAALLATYLPARRASRIHPMDALRRE